MIAAIGVIEAAGAAAPSATEQAQLTVNDRFDHFFDAWEAAAVRSTARDAMAGSSSTVAVRHDADHQPTISIPANGTHPADPSSVLGDKIVSSITTIGDAGKIGSSTGSPVSPDIDKDLSSTLAVDAVNPIHVTQTTSALEGDGSRMATVTRRPGVGDRFR